MSAADLLFKNGGGSFSAPPPPPPIKCENLPAPTPISSTPLSVITPLAAAGISLITKAITPAMSAVSAVAQEVKKTTNCILLLGAVMPFQVKLARLLKEFTVEEVVSAILSLPSSDDLIEIFAAYLAKAECKCPLPNEIVIKFKVRFIDGGDNNYMDIVLNFFPCCDEISLTYLFMALLSRGNKGLALRLSKSQYIGEALRVTLQRLLKSY